MGGPYRLQRADLAVGLGHAGLQCRLASVVGVGVGADSGQRLLVCQYEVDRRWAEGGDLGVELGPQGSTHSTCA